MAMKQLPLAGVVCGLIILMSSTATAETARDAQIQAASAPPMLTLAQADTKQEAVSEKTAEDEEHGYREVSDFFNVREANPDVAKNEWSFTLGAMWETQSNHSHDSVFVEPSIQYGVTRDFFVELGVIPISLGHGGDQGNGDLNLKLFQRFVRESECIPAIAGWAEMRIPSGDGSSGVDGTFHLNLTKTIAPKVRAHLEGWVETVNGHHGAEEGGGDEFDQVLGIGEEYNGLRHFRWGVGPGFDYKVTENFIAVLNYLMQSSEENGHHNLNTLEVGGAYNIPNTRQTVKFAMDVGLDGQEENPNFGTKFEWSIDF